MKVPFCFARFFITKQPAILECTATLPPLKPAIRSFSSPSHTARASSTVSRHCLACCNNVVSSSFLPHPISLDVIGPIHCRSITPLTCFSTAPVGDSLEETPVPSSQQYITPQLRFKKGVLSLDEIHEHLLQENGRDIVVIHLAKDVNYVEYFIIVTANSTRHLAHMSESLNRLYKSRKLESDPFTQIEGKKTAKDWQCIDFGNSVVHFMLEEVRERYELEKLWVLGPKFDDLSREAPSMEEILNKISDEGLFLLSDHKSSAALVDDVEVVNPWEMDYDEKEDSSKKWDDDEDAYII